MSAPNAYRLDALLAVVKHGCRHGFNPARPLGFYSIGNRVRCAWLAFTGRADVVIWPNDQ